jgi:transcription antitermination factor NusG
MLSTAHFDWYAFRVRPRHEKLVSMSLRAKGYEEFLPLTRSQRKWADRSTTVDMPLFPGYIFCNIDHVEIGKIRHTSGIIDVVRAGYLPLPANPYEIEDLRKVVAAKLHLESYPFIDTFTGRFRVISGPLSGMDGSLVTIRGKERLMISVEIFRRSVLIELPLSSVTSCANAISIN